MPIYEYECQAGHRFEQRQGFHDEPLRECVECDQPARRLLSPAGIIFKGSGWYITDSRPASSSSESGSSAGSAASSSAAGSDASSTDAQKSATKSEAPAAKSEAPASKKSDAAA